MGKKNQKLKALLEDEGFLFYKLQTDQTNAPGELFTVEQKLRGIAHLLEANDAEILPRPGDLNSVGTLIFSLCDDLTAIRRFVEPVLYKAKKRSSDEEA